MWIKSKLQILCEGNNIVGMKTAGTQHDHTMIPNSTACNLRVFFNNIEQMLMDYHNLI